MNFRILSDTEVSIDYQEMGFDLAPTGLTICWDGMEIPLNWHVVIPVCRVIYYRYQLNPKRLYALGEVTFNLPPLKFSFLRDSFRIEADDDGVHLFVKEDEIDNQWTVIGSIPRSVFEDRTQGSPCKKLIVYMNNLKKHRRKLRQERMQAAMEAMGLSSPEPVETL